MAIAKYVGTCKVCGTEFEVRKTCHSRREADGYEAWARENVTVCRECQRKQQDAKAIAMIAEYGLQLPEITGVSEKQIAYAQDKRARALGNDLHELGRYCKLMQQVNQTIREHHDEMIAQLAAQGKTLEESILECVEAYELNSIHKLVTTTEASKLIDACC